jgi:hypothetical protein
MTTFIEINEDEFQDRYPLVPNHFDPNASWTYDNNVGYLFETYGEEVEFVRNQDQRCIWTLIDGDDDCQCLVSGFHLVNRIGYLISQKPIPDGVEILVCLPMENASP